MFVCSKIRAIWATAPPSTSGSRTRPPAAQTSLIVNNDTVIDPGALDALVRTALSCPRAGYVTGKVYWLAEPDVFQSVGKPDEDPTSWLTVGQLGRGERDEGQYAEVVEREFVDDAYVLVRRGVYDEVGGYDPDLSLQAEEFDWQARAKRRGWRVFFTPHARLWHHGSLSMGGPGSPTSQFFYIRNIIVVMAATSVEGDSRGFTRRSPG